MLARIILVLLLLSSGAARAAEVADATGRTVTVSDHIAHVLPASPAAAVLLEAVAPDLMIGWPVLVRPDARAMLAPASSQVPEIPPLTGKVSVISEITGVKPEPDSGVRLGDAARCRFRQARAAEDGDPHHPSR